MLLPLKILRISKIVQLYNFGNSQNLLQLFCGASTLEHVNRVEKMHYTIPRLQVQHTKINKSCQWTKHWKKKLPKLDTMDGRIPFFLVTLHKVILRCSFSAHVSESQPLEDPQPRNLKHPLRIGMKSLALNSWGCKRPIRDDILYNPMLPR